MSDRPDFQQSQDIANQTLSEVDTAVTTQRAIEVVALDEFRTGTVANNEVETVKFTPQVGTIFRVRQLQFSVNATGGSGTHDISVSTFSGPVGNAIQAEFDGTEDISIDAGTVENQSASNSVTPGTQAAQVASVNSLVADDNNPVEFFYQNLTNQDETIGRTYGLVAEQIQVD